MTLPTLDDQTLLSQRMFSALMWALSHPGRVHRLPTGGMAAFVAIAATLIDLETSYYCADAELTAALARQGARALPPAAAAYQFYPQLDAAGLVQIEQAPAGSYVAPDTAATLVVGCSLGAGQRLRLSGPGSVGSTELTVGDLPANFWDVRQAAMHYPLGWDLFLVAGDQLVGVPRTTVVET